MLNSTKVTNSRVFFILLENILYYLSLWMVIHVLIDLCKICVILCRSFSCNIALLIIKLNYPKDINYKPDQYLFTLTITIWVTLGDYFSWEIILIKALNTRDTRQLESIFRLLVVVPCKFSLYNTYIVQKSYRSCKELNTFW